MLWNDLVFCFALAVFTKPSKFVLDKLLYKGLFKQVRKKLSSALFHSSVEGYFAFNLAHIPSSRPEYSHLYIGIYGLWINWSQFVLSLSGLIFGCLTLYFITAFALETYQANMQCKTISFRKLWWSVVTYFYFVIPLELALGSNDFFYFSMECFFFLVLCMNISNIKHLNPQWKPDGQQSMFLSITQVSIDFLQAFAFSCLGFLASSPDIATDSSSRFLDVNLPVSTPTLFGRLRHSLAKKLGTSEVKVPGSFHSCALEIQYSQFFLFALLALVASRQHTAVLGLMLGVALGSWFSFWDMTLIQFALQIIGDVD